MTQPKGLLPGVYVGLSMEAYHADPAIGSSGCKNLIADPELYWENSPLNPNREEDEDTAAKLFGTAYHMLILEPEQFDKAYTIKEGVKSSKVEGMIGEGDYNKMLRMRDRLKANPQHYSLLAEGVAECSIFYRDENTGLMCKIRCDRFAPAWISDLKTADDVSDKALRFSFADYGYDISGAMYSVAAMELKKMIAAGYKMPEQFSQEFVDKFMEQQNQIFAFVYQGKKPPHTTRVWCVTQWLFDVGYDKYKRALDIYKAHENVVGAWPSRYDAIENIDESMISQSINYY
jgi:hypothetical protein